MNLDSIVNKDCLDTSACKIKVSGQGSIKVPSDISTVIIGVITENEQLTVAQDENALLMNNVLDTMYAQGISSDDIKTESYTVNPLYDYTDGNRILKGYNVQHNLIVTIRRIDRIGEIIDAAVQNGANYISNLIFTVKDPGVFYRQALEAAIDDAFAKANTIGRKLSVSVSTVPVQIIEEGIQVQTYALQRIEASTPIQSGQTELIARITAIFSYA